MMRQGRRGALLITLLTIGMMTIALVPLVARGANQFASPAFAQQWNSVEAVIPNFWGPLATAREGQTEPYVEGTYNGQPGTRLVQYFDKARMEQTTPDRPVTNGLLTVELKSGNLQRGDVSFEQHPSAQISIAGDQDTPGPTYASLNDLHEQVVHNRLSVDLGYDVATKTFVRVPPVRDAELEFAAYLSDPGGRFAQDIPKAFWDFMQAIPGGWLSTMGYPIAQAFGTNVQVNGVPDTFVVVQAFERRVLTYTPSNPDAFKVEFGNIGRHYDTWRYGQGTTSPPAKPSGQLPGRFDALYNTNERVRGLLGPAQGSATQGQGAVLEFERGRLIYSGDPAAGGGTIYPLFGGPESGDTLGYSRGIGFFDPWDPNQPVGGGPGPSPGLSVPPRGFGTFWRLYAGRDRLGYATAPDATSYPLTVQTFQRGALLSTPDGQAVWVLWRENVPNSNEVTERYERIALPSP